MIESEKLLNVKRDGDGEPYTCPKCGHFVNRVEDCQGVEWSYEYDEETKDWHEINEEGYGATDVEYRCQNRDCRFIYEREDVEDL